MLVKVKSIGGQKGSEDELRVGEGVSGRNGRGGLI